MTIPKNFENLKQGHLVFETATHVHNGEYTLVAVNTLGMDNRTISATFQEDPGMHLASLYSHALQRFIMFSIISPLLCICADGPYVKSQCAWVTTPYIRL